MKFKKKSFRQAFSLIEVLIFVTILALFFVVAAAVTTAVLRDIGINTKRVEAAHRSEELLEWLKYQKDLNWGDFYDKTSTGGSTYCLNNIQWPASSGSCGASLPGDPPEKREATLTRDAGGDPDLVKIQITSTFEVLGQEYSSILNSQVSLIDQ